MLKMAGFPVALIALLLLALPRLILIPLHYAPDPNEGWNAFHAIMAASRATLYPPPGALTGNNYPPLSFYAVRFIAYFTGDAIIAGRLISLFSILAASALIWRIVTNITRNKTAAGWAAILFLAYNVTLFRSYFCLNDPQWLAHAVALLGIATLFPAEPAPLTRPRIAASSFLLVAAGFVKQNLIGFPAAITLWLLITHRRHFALWLLSGAFFTLAGLLLCRLVYGASFLPDLLFSARHYSPARAIIKSLPILAALSPMVVASLRLPRQNKQAALFPIAVTVCLVTGIIQRGGIGVDINAHFETLIAASIGTGIALAAPARKRARHWLLAPFIILVPLAAAQSIAALRHLNRNLANWHSAIAHIAAVPGNVACDNLAYCYWAGKSYSADFFLYGQRFLQTGNGTALQEAVNNHSIIAAELPGQPVSCQSNPLAHLFRAAAPAIFYRNKIIELAALPTPLPAASCSTGSAAPPVPRAAN